MHNIDGAIELRRIADVVISRYESAAAKKRDKLELRHKVIELKLPLRTVTKEEYEAVKADFETFLAKLKRNLVKK